MIRLPEPLRRRGVPRCGLPESLLAAGLFTVPGTGLSGCHPQVEETSEETLRRPGAETLIVRLDRGSLGISEHAGSEVEIEVRRSARALSRETARSGLEALLVEAVPEAASGALVVRSRVASAGVWRPGERLALRLRIAVPGGMAVDARTASGRIDLRGLTGPVRATTGSGRIRAVSLRPAAGEDAGPIRLRTADGRIEGEDLEGRVRAETGDGRIRLEGRLREVTAVSADGRIEVDAGAAAVPLGGDWLLRTANGRVRLTLPRSANAELSMPAADEPEGGESSALRWERRGPLAFATLGAGPGARIRLRTDDGSARVRIGRPD